MFPSGANVDHISVHWSLTIHVHDQYAHLRYGNVDGNVSAPAAHIHHPILKPNEFFYSRHQQEAAPAGDGDSTMQDTPSAKPAPTQAGRRPRLNLSVLTGGSGEKGERKRGKSMFGVLVNTLNKAKAEDKERNASEAVRATIIQFLRALLINYVDCYRQKRDN